MAAVAQNAAIDTSLARQMAEVQALREKLRKAEATKALDGLCSRQFNSKFVDPLANSQLRSQPGRLFAPTSPGF